ncbi:hypothetical protein C8R44DRAFT_979192 [Mycena epipterygia]|nr:hypothetical protein C8R44DRAFT_979192 [Mycena epipterygia]
MTSSTGGLDDATFAWDHRIYRYLFLSGLVVLVYDYLLTIGSEVKIIWPSKRPLSKYWFLTVRYVSLGCSAAIVAFYFGNLSPEVPPAQISGFIYSSQRIHSCSTMEKVLEGLTLLQEGFVQLTLGLRVFGMYGFNRWVLVVMLTTSTVGAALGGWTIVELGEPQMLTLEGFNGCHTAIPKSTAVWLAGAWEAQLAYDLLVFCLTVRVAWRDRSAIRLVPGSLVEILARDGALYFGIIVLANLANVLTLYLGDIMIAGILSWWTTSLSVTLISRLNLNLQRAGIGNSEPTDDTTEMTNIHFVVQNPGGPLRTEDELDSFADV